MIQDVEESFSSKRWEDSSFHIILLGCASDHDRPTMFDPTRERLSEHQQGEKNVILQRINIVSCSTKVCRVNFFFPVSWCVFPVSCNQPQFC